MLGQGKTGNNSAPLKKKQAGKKFSLTLDEWTSKKNVRYINVNTHFINKNDVDYRNLGMKSVYWKHNMH